MGFLTGKKLLITGVLSNRSIAYGIAKACHAQGAELAFSYVGERFKDRITEFAAASWPKRCSTTWTAGRPRGAGRPGRLAAAPGPGSSRTHWRSKFYSALAFLPKACTARTGTNSPPQARPTWT